MLLEITVVISLQKISGEPGGAGSYGQKRSRGHPKWKCDKVKYVLILLNPSLFGNSDGELGISFH